MPNKEFILEDLEKILQEIAEHLQEKIKIYVFGGAVMIHKRIKPATKDIDILIEKKEEYHQFFTAANKAGFVRTFVPLEYQKFYLSAMLFNYKTGGRIDLFLNRVCRKFKLNSTVKKRTIIYKNVGFIEVNFLSLEDIFLMKSLTERERDLSDMKALLGFNLNFKIILEEIKKQKRFKWDIVERLLEFEEKENIVLPLPEQLRNDFFQYQEDKNNNLLKKQVENLIAEGKNKEEIMEMFELNDEEWKKLQISI